jgi:hypothetical protein
VVTLLTTALLIRNIVMGHADFAFELQITIWLWFTVLFANFAEAVAEGRGRRRPIRCDRLARKPAPSGFCLRTMPNSMKACPPISLTQAILLFAKLATSFPVMVR